MSFAIDERALPAESGGLIVHAIPPRTVLFDRYEIVEKLADGSVASVYRAYDPIAGAHVALKVFDPLRSADPIAQKRFERELEVLSRIRHPGVARALSMLRGGELEALVLEYVEGERLSARLERGRLEVSEAIELAVRLADALDACHRAGVIHRDLKPANIVLHPQRGPVILDFGVAWLSSAMTLTRTGAIVGSPRYLAPELFESTESDERADLYSLGAILYEALAGRPVRDAGSMAELALAAQSIEPPSVASARREVTPELDAIVKRAIAPRPEDRFATARELGDALRSGRASLGAKLEVNLPCSACGTGLLIDLPICPGCGRATDWALEPGPYAVQLLEVADPSATALWLSRRHREVLRVRGPLLLRRLSRPPATLVLGASEKSAETLAARARETGCTTVTVRARRVVGPALRIPKATPNEIVAAAALHFGAVLVTGVFFVFFRVLEVVDRLLPVLAAAAGAAMVMRYVRRPLLAIAKRRKGEGDRLPIFRELEEQLARLESTRSRRMAAAAIARATPVLLATTELTAAAREEALDALSEAIGAITEMDAHLTALRKRPRAELRAALIEAEARREETAIAVLKHEEQSLTETSIAHDLAARRALEACGAITRAQAGNETPALEP